jgi:hypothetical protein
MTSTILHSDTKPTSPLTEPDTIIPVSPSFTGLPDEIKTYLFFYFEWDDLITLSHTSKSLQDSAEPHIWAYFNLDPIRRGLIGGRGPGSITGGRGRRSKRDRKENRVDALELLRIIDYDVLGDVDFESNALPQGLEKLWASLRMANLQQAITLRPQRSTYIKELSFCGWMGYMDGWRDTLSMIWPTLASVIMDFREGLALNADYATQDIGLDDTSSLTTAHALRTLQIQVRSSGLKYIDYILGLTPNLIELEMLVDPEVTVSLDHEKPIVVLRELCILHIKISSSSQLAAIVPLLRSCKAVATFRITMARSGGEKVKESSRLAGVVKDFSRLAGALVEYRDLKYMHWSAPMSHFPIIMDAWSECAEERQIPGLREFTFDWNYDLKYKVDSAGRREITDVVSDIVSHWAVNSLTWPAHCDTTHTYPSKGDNPQRAARSTSTPLRDA